MTKRLATSVALKTRNWTSRDWTTRHHIARVDNAKPENAAPDQTEVLEQSGAEQLFTDI